MPYGHDLDAMAKLVDNDTRVVFIANPNNPTGTWLNREALHTFLQALREDVVVVLDEAYTEYVSHEDFPDGVAWLAEFPNLIVTRTFSKIYGLAGLRIGYGMAGASLIDLISRVRHPFNVNMPALAAAEAALDDVEFLRRSRENNAQGLAQLAARFEALGLDYIPSAGNFITVDLRRNGGEIYQKLLENGVIVRPVVNCCLPTHLRVTVGSSEEKRTFSASAGKGAGLMIRKLAVIGVGLIGGSLARALRKAGKVQEIVGCGRGKANLEKALELGVIDSYTHDIGEAVEGADMVFLAVPLGAMKDAFAAMVGHLAVDAVITDGGSSKASVVADAGAAFGEVPAMLVPGHPIAGTEKNGVEASFAELYQDRRVILTPTESTDPEATARVRAMWEACGAEVSEMTVGHHDEVLAATSHLPHMLAFGLVDALSRMKENDEIFRYAAGGFRDFTRIASSNPVMWRDVCVANGPALSKMLAAFAEEMNDLAQTIAAGDGEHLLEVFSPRQGSAGPFRGWAAIQTINRVDHLVPFKHPFSCPQRRRPERPLARSR